MSITETKFGEIPTNVLHQTVRVSADGRHLGAIAQDHGASFAVVDGVSELRFESIKPRTFHLNPNGSGAVYIGSRAEKSFLVIGGNETAINGELVFSGFVPVPSVSPDGNHVAIAVTRGQTDFLIVDGAEAGPYEKIESLTYGSDSRLLVLAKRDGGHVLLHGGDVHGPFDLVGLPVLSPDGRRFAFTVQRPDGWHMRLDDIEGPAYQQLGQPVFSQDGAHLAYVAGSDAGVVAVVDGVESRPYASIGSLIFSPDATRQAFVATTAENRQLVVLDGTDQPSFVRADGMTFSPDSKRFAYLVGEGTATYAVVDGKAGAAAYPSIVVPSLRFSPDSGHVVFRAHSDGSDGMDIIVRDGVEAGSGMELSDPVFSDDSRQVIYSGVDQAAYVDINGNRVGGYSRLFLNALHAGDVVRFAAARGVDVLRIEASLDLVA